MTATRVQRPASAQENYGLHGLSSPYSPQAGFVKKDGISTSPLTTMVRQREANASWPRSPSSGSLSQNDDVYQTYRKATRPVVGRHTTSTQYVHTNMSSRESGGHAVGAIQHPYGTRKAARSAEDIPQRWVLQAERAVDEPAQHVSIRDPQSALQDEKRLGAMHATAPTGIDSPQPEVVVQNVMTGGSATNTWTSADEDIQPARPSTSAQRALSEPRTATISERLADAVDSSSGELSEVAPRSVTGPKRQIDSDAAEALTVPRSPTPMAFESTTKSSLKARLRKALSFNSSAALNDEESRPKGRLFTHSNRSNDNLSIASTASSASMVLRKMSHGLSKRTKRTFNGIFSGSRSRSGQDEPASDRKSPEPGRPTSGVSYITAEVESPSRVRPEHGSFSHLRSDSMSNLRQGSSRSPPAEIRSADDRLIAEEVAPANVDGHGSVAFPRLSEEIARPALPSDARRSSMHLERALPAPDTEVLPPMRGRRGRFQRGKSASVSDLSAIVNQAHLISAPGAEQDVVASVVDRHPFRGRGILKRRAVSDTAALVAEKRPVHEKQQTHDFSFDFGAKGPDLELGGFGLDPPSDSQLVSVPAPAPAPAANAADKAAGPASRVADLTALAKAGALGLHFNPRVTIHDTYDALEYDRRGDVATCNRLTPVLAQRIKEELNAYKMEEMSVAEESKVFTQFFV